MTVAFPKSLADWQFIAEKISTGGFQPSGRGARERWVKVIRVKFKAENTASLKRSGI